MFLWQVDRFSFSQGVLPGPHKFIRGREAVFGILGQCLENHLLDGWVNIRLYEGGQRKGITDMLEQNRQRSICHKGHAPCDHFIKDDAKGINIGTLIDIIALRLFRTDIGRCAHDRIRLREAWGGAFQ